MSIQKVIVLSTAFLVIFAFARVNTDKKISGLIAEKQELSILNEAINTADLVDLLRAEGPYTFFAPTNEALKKLPEGRLDELLKDENTDELRKLLKYHIVSGEIEASDVRGEHLYKTLEGSQIKLTDGTENFQNEETQQEENSEQENDTKTDFLGNKVRVNNARLVEEGITAENGVLYIIDAVVMPSDLEVGDS